MTNFDEILELIQPLDYSKFKVTPEFEAILFKTLSVIKIQPLKSIPNSFESVSTSSIIRVQYIIEWKKVIDNLSNFQFNLEIIECIKYIIYLEPFNETNWIDLGMAEINANYDDRAIKIFEYLVSIDSSNIVIWNKLLYLYSKSGQTYQVNRCNQKIRELNSEPKIMLKKNSDQNKTQISIDTYLFAGKLKYNQDKFDEARIEYENALKIEPYNIEALFQLAMCDYKKGIFNNAFDNFKQLLDLIIKTKNLNVSRQLMFDTAFNMGEILFAYEDYTKAIELYALAINFSPRTWYPMYRVTQIYTMQMYLSGKFSYMDWDYARQYLAETKTFVKSQDDLKKTQELEFYISKKKKYTPPKVLFSTAYNVTDIIRETLESEVKKGNIQNFEVGHLDNYSPSSPKIQGISTETQINSHPSQNSNSSNNQTGKICPLCQTRNLINHKYCIYCGNAI